jgi:predicted metalloprotease with PDZ domain
MARVEYVVDLADRNTHLYRVEARFPWSGSGDFLLRLPVWTPGSYLVREFERHLQEVHFTDGTGRPIPAGKLDKSTWSIEAGAATVVVARYRVYAYDLTVRAAHLDDTHGFWNGACLFLYHPALVQLPQRVRVVAPGWQVTVALPEVAPATYEAVDYDELVDSPFECGMHEVVHFAAQGKPHRLAIWGEVPLARDRLTADLTKIIDAAATLFDGSVPYEEYAFLLHSTPGGYGGLEHRRSCTLSTTPFGFAPQKKYEEFLELCSHEFFHLWNVKRIRPEVLGPFDYQREAYTRCLWVMEGVTSYYDRLLLVRAGLKKPRAYLTSLGEELGKLAQTPGRLRHSLEEASFDAWIKFYRPDENSANSSVSYYLKGGLVSLMLDLTIRARSEQGRSLDDVVRLLWRRYGARGIGFPEGEVQALCEEASGLSLRDFFDRYVRGTVELDLAPLLRSVGLVLEAGRGDGVPWLGITTRAASGAAIVSASLAGGPAEAAGLYANDELVALDGFRLEAADLKARLRARRPGDKVQLTVFRRDQLRSIEVTLAERPADEIEIKAAPDPTAAEGAAFQRWLGAPLSSLEGDEEDDR